MAASRLLVLDIDRTLLKSDAFSVEVAVSLAAIARLDNDQMTRLIERSTDSGEQFFDYLGWAAREFQIDLPTADQVVADILDRYPAEQRSQLERRVIMPGTVALLRLAQREGWSVLLMTAGAVELQQVKIAILQALMAGFNLEGVISDYLITPLHLIKAQLLATAFQANHFIIDSLAAAALDARLTRERYGNVATITLVDDKPAYLVSDDRRVQGILVAANGSVIQTGNLQHAPDLSKVAELLKTVS